MATDQMESFILLMNINENKVAFSNIRLRFMLQKCADFWTFSFLGEKGEKIIYLCVTMRAKETEKMGNMW